MEKKTAIKAASYADIGLLADIISSSFKDIATRFELTPANCPRHPSNCSPEWIEADIKRGVSYFILSDNKGSVGCVGVEEGKDGFFYIERLSVLPSERHNGYGSTLLIHALNFSRECSAEKISIGIIAAQTELRNWYSEFGFRETGRKRFAHLPFEVCFMELAIKEYPDCITDMASVRVSDV